VALKRVLIDFSYFTEFLFHGWFMSMKQTKNNKKFPKISVSVGSDENDFELTGEL